MQATWPHETKSLSSTGAYPDILCPEHYLSRVWAREVVSVVVRPSSGYSTQRRYGCPQ